MMVTALIAAITIAFPKEGAQLPSLSRVYMLGATDGGETNLVVAGKDVPVYRTGAWATTVELVSGTNVVTVGDCRRSFVVASGQPYVETKKKYLKLEYAADKPKAHPQGRDPSAITVAIDAGHGGKDVGALSPHGWMEKDANLLMAKAVRRELMARGFKVVMTRDDDSAVELYDRPKAAHSNSADAFVSIHHNAPPYDRDPIKCRYHTVYAWNEIGERLAKAVNLRMAKAFGEELEDQGVKHANFAVTRNPEIPSCLIEVDFVSSPAGEESIWDEKTRRRTASAIADGITDWSRQP